MGRFWEAGPGASGALLPCCLRGLKPPASEKLGEVAPRRPFPAQAAGRTSGHICDCDVFHRRSEFAAPPILCWANFAERVVLMDRLVACDRGLFLFHGPLFGWFVPDRGLDSGIRTHEGYSFVRNEFWERVFFFSRSFRRFACSEFFLNWKQWCCLGTNYYICSNRTKFWIKKLVGIIPVEQNTRIVPMEHNSLETNYFICSSGHKFKFVMWNIIPFEKIHELFEMEHNLFHLFLQNKK